MRNNLEPGRNKKVYDRSTRQVVQPRPAAPRASATEVWDRVDALLLDERVDAPLPAAVPVQRVRGAARKSRRFKRRMWALDCIAAILWIVSLTKLLVADVDRFLIDSMWPQGVWVLDLRWAVGLMMVALLLVLFRRRTLALTFGYVAAYPAVLLLWKLPKFLLRRRSRSLTFAVANGLAAIVVQARRLVSTVAITTFSVLLIVMSQTNWLIAMGALGLLTTLTWTIVVGMGDLMRSSRFLAAQQMAIEWLLGSGHIERFLTPKHPNKISIKDWTTADARAYRDAAGATVLVNRVLNFWAYTIDEYRRGPVVSFAGVGFLVLLLAHIAFTFSFVTAAIFTIDPGQYSYSIAPQWWTFLNYSVTSMYFGEAGALQAVGGFAVVAKLLAGVFGIVVVGTVGTSVVLAQRAARNERVASVAVQLLEEKCALVNDLALEDYKLDADELETRLVTSSWGLAPIVEWIRKLTPARETQR